MSTEIILDENKYISSKRASEMTGYAQDYIGQLSRGSLIDARRIGGLWYVSTDSILAHKNKADDSRPKPPEHHANVFPDAEAFVHLDGKEYISASRASKITGYNQDYVGQLARGGKIISRQIGNRWYVDKDALLAHKEEKDALLAVVQVQSVGIVEKKNNNISHGQDLKYDALLTYTSDDGDFLPSIAQKDEQIRDIEEDSAYVNVVPIRIIGSRNHTGVLSPSIQNNRLANITKLGTGKFKIAIRGAIFSATVLIVVIALSFGLISLKKDSLYAVETPPQVKSLSVLDRLGSSTMVANAMSGFNMIVSFIEESLTVELIYRRTK